MGQDQMVVRQRQPQLFFQPGDVLGKAIGPPGEAAILLPLGQVVPFDEAGVDRVIPITNKFYCFSADKIKSKLVKETTSLGRSD
ncbi:MAG: hypothetical protein IPM89_15770 [Candidatus Competibacteraceae bacterium]|nr:MAG: hypothetical protein IPM89_15770 [Candidatus Competibacteraceae bacterium]